MTEVAVPLVSAVPTGGEAKEYRRAAKATATQTIATTLKLREEIWRLEANEAEPFTENASPRSH